MRERRERRSLPALAELRGGQVDSLAPGLHGDPAGHRRRPEGAHEGRRGPAPRRLHQPAAHHSLVRQRRALFLLFVVVRARLFAFFVRRGKQRELGLIGVVGRVDRDRRPIRHGARG